MHRYLAWAWFGASLVFLMPVFASSASAQAAPAAPPPSALAPPPPPAAAPPPPSAQYQTQQAAPPPQQGYPVQQGYPIQQGYPVQQGYPPQGYAPAPQPGYAPYSTPYAQQYPAPPRRRRASLGLMIAGLSVLGGSYLIATAVGASLMDDDDDFDSDCRSCKDVGPWLFLPVAGPFIAMSQTGSGDGALWFLGMVETVGLALTIGGIIRYKNTKREAEGAALSWNLPHDRTLSLDVSTSSRMAGPQLKLRF